MTAKKFYDWQTVGGTDDVMRLVDCLERADIPWCAIGGVAVNHWAAEPMVTQDVDFVVAADAIERAAEILTEAEFEPRGSSGRSTSRDSRKSASSSAPRISIATFRSGPLPPMCMASCSAWPRWRTR